MTARSSSKKQLVATLREASEVFKVTAKKAKILPLLGWQPEVAAEFFRNKEQALPKPIYQVDRKSLTDLLEPLATLRNRLQGDHPVLAWLERTRLSFEQGIQLVLEIETPAFFELSSQIYGNSQTKLYKGETSYLELSRLIASRMAVCNIGDIKEYSTHYTAKEFAAKVEARLKRREPTIQVKVEVTDAIAAKVVAGMNRVRVREDARFSHMDLNALWNHEIESHCLTAHNGAAQENCDFLSAGGPRTTLTQEGLAVFFEVYGHTMSQDRFLTLCNRVEASHKVEEGADFMELYRWYKGYSSNEMEAFYSAQRVFRGAPLSGGKPFTKDIVYLAGLLGVYNFLRAAVKGQNRLLVDSLVAGRIAIEDVATIAWLRTHGVLSPPAYVPDWLENWEALLSFFSLSGVLGALDLSNFQAYIDEFKALEDWDLTL